MKWQMAELGTNLRSYSQTNQPGCRMSDATHADEIDAHYEIQQLSWNLIKLCNVNVT